MTSRETQLEPWEEAIGNYESLKITEHKVTLTLTYTIKSLAITFPKESLEAKTLIQTLRNTLKVQKSHYSKPTYPKNH